MTTLLDRPEQGDSLEALIKEARRRQRLRWFAVVLLVLMLSAGVTGFIESQGGSSTKESQTAATRRPHHLAAQSKSRRATSSTEPGQPEDLAFTNAEDGWVVESRFCKDGLSGCGSLIEATANGGDTWARQYKGPGELDQVSFSAPGIGWAWGGACSYDLFFDESVPSPRCHDMLVTTTNGRNWRRVATPVGADKFVFTDALHGWAATYQCEYQFDGSETSIEPKTCPSTIYSTDDAGHTWRPVLDLQTSVLALGTFDSRPVIVEQGLPINIDGTDALSIVRGNQAGTQWSELATLSVQLGSYNLLVSFDLGPSGDGWMEAFNTGDACGMGGCEQDLLVTRSGGRSWTSLDGLDQVFSSSQKPCMGGPGGLIPAGSPSSALAVSIIGNGVCTNPIGLVAVSDDGGRTWTHDSSLGSHMPRALSMPTSRTGWILVSSGSAGDRWSLFTTDNGGASWRLSAAVPTG